METHKRNTDLNSIVQSPQYKISIDSGKVGPKDLTLQLNTDGVVATKSSKLSFWPVLLTINELPLTKRTDNMLLACVWMGKNKPCMDSLLQPVIAELRELANTGIHTKRGQTKVFCILCPVDSPARADLQKILNPGGKYSCPWCYHKARSVKKGKGSTRVFKHKRLTKKRTQANYLRFAKTRHTRSLYECKGVKGVSSLVRIPAFDVINGFVVDYMHAFCIGIFSQYLDALFGLEFSKEDWSLRKSTSKADKLFLTVTPSHELTRLPEPISAYKGMKASLKKSLFCYFLLPILKALGLPQKFINNAFLLIYSFRKYLQSSISGLDALKARLSLEKFLSQLSSLFSETMLIYNMHIARHVPDICQLWGGLWDASTFSYESKNGLLTKLHHGTVGQPDQILRNFQRIRAVKESEISRADYHNADVHDLYRTLLTGRTEIKNFSRIGDCLFLGTSRSSRLNEAQLTSIQEDHPDSELLPVSQIFKRFILRKIVACTKNYTRMKRRRNYVFEDNQRTALAIHDVMVCSFVNGDQRAYAVGKKLKKSEEKIAWDDELLIDSRDFIHCITEDDDMVVLNVECLSEKLVCFDVEEKTYICKLVNTLEGD